MSPVIAPEAAPTATAFAHRASLQAVVRQASVAPYGWVVDSVREGDTLTAIAARAGTTIGALTSKNHLSDGGDLLSVGQRLWVPRTAAQARAEASRAAAAAAARAAAAAAAERRAIYVVRSGDTLSGVAAHRGVTLAALLKANRLSMGSILQIGQRLRVPGTTPAAPPTRTAAARAASPVRAAQLSAATRTSYRVRSGDTLGAIAARTHTPLASLLSWNRLSARSIIRPGQVLTVKGTPPAPARQAQAARAATVPATTAYTIRSGDTLSEIAVRTGTTVAALLKANHLPAPSLLQVGQKIRIPVRKPAATSANTFAGRTYSVAIVDAATANRDLLASRPVPTRAQTREMIVAIARRHGLDPRLALAIGWQESGWNQRQVSVANAIGVMQVIPSSGAWASDLAGRRLDLLNARDNITAGVVILRSLTRATPDANKAIAGYYQGLASVLSNGMYPDTKAYVASVKAHRGMF